MYTNLIENYQNKTHTTLILNHLFLSYLSNRLLEDQSVFTIASPVHRKPTWPTATGTEYFFIFIERGKEGEREGKKH